MGKRTLKSAALLPIVLMALYFFYSGGNKPPANTLAETKSTATAQGVLSPQALSQTQSDFAYDLTCQVMSVTDDVTLVCLTEAQEKVKITLGQIDIPKEELALVYPSEFKDGEEPNTVAQIASLQALTTADAHSGNFSCAGKYYCKEMTSCAEAQFYLNQCGLSRLDRDGDGIPCETLCR